MIVSVNRMRWRPLRLLAYLVVVICIAFLTDSVYELVITQRFIHAPVRIAMEGTVITTLVLMASFVTAKDTFFDRQVGIKMRLSTPSPFASYKGVSLTKSVRIKRDPQRALSPHDRYKVIARDDSACRYCGKKLLARQVHIDHVYPYSRGGETTVENSVVSCRSCNLKKSNKVGIWPSKLTGGSK